jgi:VanZ family protein
MQTLLRWLTPLYDRLGILKSTPVRYVLAITWTLYSTVLLVQSSGNPVVGRPAPPGPPTMDREIILTIGHIVVFSTLVILWQWALSTFRPVRAALFVATGFAVIFGVISELAQFAVPDRTVSLGDLSVNVLAALGASLVIGWMFSA